MKKLSFEQYRKKYYLYSSRGMYVDIRNNERISYEEGELRYLRDMNIKKDLYKKAEVGSINDDFIHHWLTIRLTREDDAEKSFKYSVEDKVFYNFYFNHATSETEVIPVSSEMHDILQEHLLSDKTIWYINKES